MVYCFHRLMTKWRLEDSVKHQMNAFKEVTDSVVLSHVIAVNVHAF